MSTISAAPVADGTPPAVQIGFAVDTDGPVRITRRDPDKSRPVRGVDPQTYTAGTVANVYDYEAPFGVPVTYELVGSTRRDHVTAGPVTLNPSAWYPNDQGWSTDRGACWLRHLTKPPLSMPIDLSNSDALTFTQTRSVAEVLNRRDHVVLSDARRKAATTTLDIRVWSLEEGQALRELLADNTAVLLSVPAAERWGFTNHYVTCGDLTEERLVQEWAPFEYRVFHLPVEEVERPAGGVVYPACCYWAEARPEPDYLAMNGRYDTYAAMTACQANTPDPDPDPDTDAPKAATGRASGQLAATGVRTGRHAGTGRSAGTITITGTRTASASKPGPKAATGTLTGTLAASATRTGRKTGQGAAAKSTGFTATRTGRKAGRGALAGSTGITGVLTGNATKPAVVLGSTSGSTTFTAQSQPYLLTSVGGSYTAGKSYTVAAHLNNVLQDTGGTIQLTLIAVPGTTDSTNVAANTTIDDSNQYTGGSTYATFSRSATWTPGTSGNYRVCAVVRGTSNNTSTSTGSGSKNPDVSKKYTNQAFPSILAPATFLPSTAGTVRFSSEATRITPDGGGGFVFSILVVPGSVATTTGATTIFTDTTSYTGIDAAGYKSASCLFTWQPPTQQVYTAFIYLTSTTNSTWSTYSSASLSSVDQYITYTTPPQGNSFSTLGASTSTYDLAISG